MTKAFIIAADKITDSIGNLDRSRQLQAQISQLGISITQLEIDPLRADWHRPEEPHSFRSGCAPIEALSKALRLIQDGEQAVVIQGEDHIKSGYSREERQQLMAVYGADYPLTQAYTELAHEFIRQQSIDPEEFTELSGALFENHKASYLDAVRQQGADDQTPQNAHTEKLPDQRWYKKVTELFRGVDCANPVVDFCGRLLICSEALLHRLQIPLAQATEIKSVGLGRLPQDGRAQIANIAEYAHLRTAYQQACDEAELDFAKAFKDGQALLDTYTCYPVVPMAFLLHCGLIDELDELADFLGRFNITVTGGMNLARGAWNNPALNGLISMHRRLLSGEQNLGLVHGNGGLGYRQGVAILASASAG